MRFSDYIRQSFSNLLRKKLRTFLTTFGVVIGIGALVSMFAFGKGVQKTLTDTFNDLGLFNYINVFPKSQNRQAVTTPASPNANSQQNLLLDDNFLRELSQIEGVDIAFPEVSFPAMVRFGENEEFSIVQALPAEICGGRFLEMLAGTAYASDDDESLIITESMLNHMGVRDPETAIGKEIEISTMAFDLSSDNIENLLSFVGGEGLPFANNTYRFIIAGVSENIGMSGLIPMRSNVFIPFGTASKMKKISVTSIADIFESIQQQTGYSTITVKLSSPKYIDSVRRWIEDSGFEAFALIDQLEEFKKVFIYVDLFLFAVGMIGIVVASLGIINTLTMSIMERYKEIGIMKAVGASDKDVQVIFLFESGLIGFWGGVFGLALGWIVSMIINYIANIYVEGVYFSFPYWLCLGSIAFSILVSLIAGIYPTLRAAKVDPVVALRHD